jgi:regulator of sigma E protease
VTFPVRERAGKNPWSALVASGRQVGDILVLTKNAITGVIVGSTNPQLEGPTTIGPVGIGQLTGEIATSEAGSSAKVITLVSLAATLSLSLAIINILPIPALDGGRLLFVIIEWARGGKRISPEREGLVHLAGMIMILALVALISVQDVLRIFRGERFF